MTEHSMAPGVLVFSKKSWNKLSIEDRAIVRAAAQDSVPYMRERWAEYEGAARKVVEAAGAEIRRRRQAVLLRCVPAALCQSCHRSLSARSGEANSGYPNERSMIERCPPSHPSGSAREAEPQHAVALRFCSALSVEVSRQPMQWRSALVIAARAGIRNARHVERAIAYASEQGLARGRQRSRLSHRER
jgi:hypothetical protein